jgi:Rad3-related DNA helicase
VWLRELEEYLKDRTKEHERGRAQFVAEHGVRKWRRRLNALQGLKVNIAIAANDDNPWVYQGPSEHSRKGYDKATLRPVWVGEWVHGFVWDHSDQWVLMSASFANIDLTAKHLGLEPHEYAAVYIDYSFPAERKPVRFWPGAKAYTKKNEREGFDAVRDAAMKIRTILDWYPDDRILIHTFSHQRTKDIAEMLSDPRVIAFEGGGVTVRDGCLAAFREIEGSVLIGAGMERGYDFRYDECRVVIVAKTPFPDFGDPVIAARTRSAMGQSWYDLTTARSMVQMVGRGMRAEDDAVVVYILDASANKFLRGEGNIYLPSSFMDSVKFGRPLKAEAIIG